MAEKQTYWQKAEVRSTTALIELVCSPIDSDTSSIWSASSMTKILTLFILIRTRWIRSRIVPGVPTTSWASIGVRSRDMPLPAKNDLTPV